MSIVREVYTVNSEPIIQRITDFITQYGGDFVNDVTVDENNNNKIYFYKGSHKLASLEKNGNNIVRVIFGFDDDVNYTVTNASTTINAVKTSNGVIFTFMSSTTYLGSLVFAKTNDMLPLAIATTQTRFIFALSSDDRYINSTPNVTSRATTNSYYTMLIHIPTFSQSETIRYANNIFGIVTIQSSDPTIPFIYDGYLHISDGCLVLKDDVYTG